MIDMALASREFSEILLLLNMRPLLAFSLRFCVDRSFSRERLPVPNRSDGDAFDLPHGLRLNLGFVLGDEGSEDVTEFVHTEFENWPSRDTPDVSVFLRRVLTWPAPCVGHDMIPDLCWLQFLDLPIPGRLWDIRVAQRTLTLGEVNRKARCRPIQDLARQIDTGEACRREQDARLKIGGIADELNLCCGSNPLLAVFQEVYARQRGLADRQGCLNHLETVEMPWLNVVADLHFWGVRIDVQKHRQLLQAACRHQDRLSAALKSYGLDNPNSYQELRQVFTREGLADYFTTGGGGFSLEDDLLEVYEKFPLVRLLRKYRKVSHVISVQMSVRQHLTDRGKVHPKHVQLGTETGRQTSHAPNILGFDRIQRNLVVPSEGCGIAEVDYSQYEVGIAAGMYQDDHLIRMYNAGDVYTQIAQAFFAGRSGVPSEAKAWPEEVFRETYPRLRGTMKTVTLAILYGQEAHGLSRRLEITPAEAHQFIEAYFELFPRLHQGMNRAVNESLRRGYIELVNGLRIALDPHPAISDSARRRCAKNYPVQGSGAVIFKTAGSRLQEIFPAYGARLLVPMHDAFIFQAPRENLEKVIDLTCHHMVAAMKQYFPMLEPKVQRNSQCPQRWIKEGQPEALEEFLGMCRAGELPV